MDEAALRLVYADLRTLDAAMDHAEQDGLIGCVRLVDSLGGMKEFRSLIGDLAMLRERLKACRPVRTQRIREAGGSFTKDEIIILLDRQNGRCAYARSNAKPAHCRGKITKRTCQRDHMTPIARGGSNDIGNIQLTCGPCNQRKHAADPVAFAQKIGLLI